MKSYTAGQQTTLFRRQRSCKFIPNNGQSHSTTCHFQSSSKITYDTDSTQCTTPHFHAGTYASSVRHTQVKPILSSLELITCDNKKNWRQERCLAANSARSTNQPLKIHCYLFSFLFLQWLFFLLLLLLLSTEKNQVYYWKCSYPNLKSNSCTIEAHRTWREKQDRKEPLS